MLNPILLEKGIQALIGVPLLVNGAVIGVLHVGSVHDRVFTTDDAVLLQLAADRAAVAVQSLRSREDRAAAAAVQRSLLPSAPPTVVGVEIAARYVPGDGQVGGDWYDVFTLPSGELCVVIGDVAGSGLEAAIIMGRMRSALRAYALETRDPAEVLRRLDHKIQHFETDAMATVSNAVLDPAAGELRISAAGHFPPVVTAPGQRGALAEIAVDVPIGVADIPQRQATTLRLTPGAVLCFFTDGLVERRDTPLDDRITRLCETVSPGPPEQRLRRGDGGPSRKRPRPGRYRPPCPALATPHRWRISLTTWAFGFPLDMVRLRLRVSLTPGSGFPRGRSLLRRALRVRFSLTDQPPAAQASRSVIDQAIGMIMAQERCPAAQAFAILRTAFAEPQRQLREIARDNVTSVSGAPPEPVPFGE